MTIPDSVLFLTSTGVLLAIAAKVDAHLSRRSPVIRERHLSTYDLQQHRKAHEQAYVHAFPAMESREYV